MPTPRGFDPTRGQVRASFWILLVATLLITRIGSFWGNQAIQVPLVNWLNDRSLYPGDPFVAVLARYPSALWPLVAAVARIVPLEASLQVLYVLERLFALYAAGRLARALAPGSALAVVAAMTLFAFPLDPMVGSGTIVELYLEQTSLSIPCILLAAASFHEQRPLTWAIWLALGFNLTGMYGAFALSYFGATFLLDADYRGAWRSWGRALALFVLVASYGIYGTLAASRFHPADDDVWFAAALARGSWHYFPLTWDWRDFARFAAFLVLLAAILTPARRESARLFRHVAVWAGVGLAWLAVAFLAPYVLHSRPLLMMQPARATDLLITFGGIAMISVASSRFGANPDSRSRRWWVLALSAAFLIWLPDGLTIVAPVVALAVLTPLAPMLMRRLSPRLVAWLLVAWVVLCAVDYVQARWHDYDHDLKALIFRQPGEVTRQLAAWAETSTPKDGVFLLNTSAHSEFDQFMGLAKRSILTSTEEGTALHWAPDFVPEWNARMKALGVDPVYDPEGSIEDDFEVAVRDLKDDDVLRLKRRYRLNYWVVSDQRVSRFPSVWVGYGYKVLEIP